jgi:hypothetical protein
MWAYHATTPTALRTIMRQGLRPQRQPAKHRGEARGTARPAIFFAPSRDLAAVWGPVVVRFPWPDEAYEDPYSDSTLVDGEVVATHYYSFEAVPARAIELVPPAGRSRPSARARG